MKKELLPNSKPISEPSNNLFLLVIYQIEGSTLLAPISLVMANFWFMDEKLNQIPKDAQGKMLAFQSIDSFAEWLENGGQETLGSQKLGALDANRLEYIKVNIEESIELLTKEGDDTTGCVFDFLSMLDEFLRNLHCDQDGITYESSDIAYKMRFARIHISSTCNGRIRGLFEKSLAKIDFIQGIEAVLRYSQRNIRLYI